MLDQLNFYFDICEVIECPVSALQVDPLTHQVKICDFGSAKVLVSHLLCCLILNLLFFA